jgi:YbbR domain-containing protein
MFIRLLAIVVGALLWVIIRIDVQGSLQPLQGTTYSENYFDVAVQVKQLNETRFSLRSIQPQKIALTVTGSQTALGRVSIRDYEVFVDVAKGVPGEQRVQLQTRGFPSDVNVQLDPSSVVVFLDEKQRKEMPIDIELSGNAKNGYAVGVPIVAPNRAIVTVTQTSSNDVVRVFGRVALNEGEETIETPVPLVALDKDGKPLDVSISPSVVNVKVPITSPFRTVPLQVSLIGTPPAGTAIVRVDQQPSTVTVYGDQEAVEQMSYYPGPELDVSAFTKTTQVTLPIAATERIARTEPASVSVTVEMEQATTMQIADVPIAIVGKNEAYVLEWGSKERGKRTVSLTMAQSRSKNIDNNVVQAFVDVTNVPPGEHVVPIDVRVPPYVQTQILGMATATVRIKEKKSE